MRFAVISNIHGNLEALQVVLEDIEEQGVHRIICLGDLVIYGPNPVECVDTIFQCADVVLRGHCEESLVWGFANWTAHAAAKSGEWCVDLLKPTPVSDHHARRRWERLTDLPLRHTEGTDLFVHGSPRDPSCEYINIGDVTSDWERQKMDEIFSLFERRLFVGHTRVPCVITEDRRVFTDTELCHHYEPADLGKIIVNVGSVGRPGDRDNRTCYVIVDGDEITWRRLAYDLDETAQKIRATSQLDDKFAKWLAEGF